MIINPLLCPLASIPSHLHGEHREVQATAGNKPPFMAAQEEAWAGSLSCHLAFFSQVEPHLRQSLGAVPDNVAGSSTSLLPDYLRSALQDGEVYLWILKHRNCSQTAYYGGDMES